MALIGPHRIVTQIISILNLFGIWGGTGNRILNFLTQITHFLLSGLIFIAMIVRVVHTNNINESLFLAAGVVCGAIHGVKLLYVLTRKDQLLSLFDDVCFHSVSDSEEFGRVQLRLNNFAKFGYMFMVSFSVGIVGFFIVTLPLFTTKVALPLDISFPLDWRKDKVSYWLAHLFVVGGVFTDTLASFFTIACWYTLFNCSLKYQILGNQFRALGQRTDDDINYRKDISPEEKEKLFSRHIVELVTTHRNIRNKIANVKSAFSHLFMIQITLISIGICCSVYIMAFSSPDSPDFVRQVVMSALILGVDGFDLFVVFYLCNQITVASAELIYCVFESDWVGQIKSKRVTKDLLILMEVLKRPQRLIIMKLYSIDLVTFTSIVKLSYSMFNILKTLDK